MQRHQHNKFILNQPQQICTSTQSHWKDKSVINNFHVYYKIKIKTETCEKYNRTRNRHSATEQFARRTQLLVVARDGVYSLGGENIRCGELGSTRRATKNTRCDELGTTRQATKYTRWASDDIFSLGEIEHSSWRVMTDRSTNRPLSHSKTLISTTPNPKTDRKHYLLLFYNLDITSSH